ALMLRSRASSAFTRVLHAPQPRSPASSTRLNACRVRGSSLNRWPYSSLTMSNSAHLLVPATRRRPGYAFIFEPTEPRGGRSADPPPIHPHAASGCPRLLQRLSLLSCAPLTPPLTSSGYIVCNQDRA